MHAMACANICGRHFLKILIKKKNQIFIYYDKYLSEMVLWSLAVSAIASVIYTVVKPWHASNVLVTLHRKQWDSYTQWYVLIFWADCYCKNLFQICIQFNVKISGTLVMMPFCLFCSLWFWFQYFIFCFCHFTIYFYGKIFICMKF